MPVSTKIWLPEKRITRQLCLAAGLGAALTLISCSSSTSGLSSSTSTSTSTSTTSTSTDQQITSTTTQYVEEFYPLWFTYYQSQYTNVNQLAGPDTITPAYQIVVAINDDT